MKDIRYVIVHAPGPAWQAGVPMFEQAGLDEHVAHYRQLHAQHKLMAGGPFLDAAGGGMMVSAPGVAEQELVAFVQADPCVRSGLLTAVVRPWLLGLKPQHE